MASNTVINTNITALTAHRNLGSVGNKLSTASKRLSSGKRINSAADDAAGLAISDKMRAQINGLDMASKNAEDAISLIQTAEGSISEIDSMLQRMRELTVQAANDTNTSSDRQKIATELEQLQTEITDMAGRTEFNDKKLATGAYATTALDFHIGANEDQRISINIESMTASSLSVDQVASTIKDAQANGSSDTIGDLLTTIDAALSTVATQRANLGAVQNRLEYTNENLQISSENLSSAKSRIEDADMAEEMMDFTAANVLQQAATSMLAQANQSQSQITQLLG